MNGAEQQQQESVRAHSHTPVPAGGYPYIPNLLQAKGAPADARAKIYRFILEGNPSKDSLPPERGCDGQESPTTERIPKETSLGKPYHLVASLSKAWARGDSLLMRIAAIRE